jgi:SAM-dependent methyltransferase
VIGRGADLRERSREPEILDGADLDEEARERCFADLARVHGWLGNHAAILRRLRRDPEPVNRVLDIGCGHGLLLKEIHAKLGAEVVGMDLVPPRRPAGITILSGDAVRDPLPTADVAVSVMVVHHLSAEELAGLIRNVGHSCRRFLILDLVRHPIPHLLFRCFIAPLVNPINAHDGVLSLERAFTPPELRRIVAEALTGSGARFRHTVTPLYVRQIVDIRY